MKKMNQKKNQTPPPFPSTSFHPPKKKNTSEKHNGGMFSVSISLGIGNVFFLNIFLSKVF